jgi:integrase
MFQHIKKVGYICPACRTVPNRFYIDLWHDGKRVRLFSDKTGQVLDTYQRAQTLLSHIRYEIQHHTFDSSKYISSDVKRFLFEEQIEDFLKEKKIEETKANISPSYIGSLTNFKNNYYLPFFRGKDVRDITSKEIRDFYHQLPQRKEKTIKNVLDALRHFFRNLYKYEIIERIPVFPVIRVPESIPSWTSTENQLKLLDAIPTIHKPIFTFILFQGVRPSEGRALKWRDVNLSNKIIIIRRTFSTSKIVERTKGRNIKPRLIHPLVFDVLTELQKGLPEGFVFTNPTTHKPYSKTRLENIFLIARKATGINIHLYAAGRHSVATNAAMAGVDARIIRDYLGHADTRTTDVYTHLDVVAQKQIFEKCKIHNLDVDRHQTVTDADG